MPPTLAKSEATFCSLSPTYFEKSSGPLTAMKLVRASPARAWHRRAWALRRGLHAWAVATEERGAVGSEGRRRRGASGEEGGGRALAASVFEQPGGP